MQDIFGSVRRSLVFRQNPHADESGAVGGGIVERTGSCLRKSKAELGGLGMGFLSRIQSLAPLPEPPPVDTASSAQDCVPAIRWRKGEPIGCGAFGHVYMGMNLDSRELLVVKQVMIGTSSAFKEKAQDNIRELEEEVKLLKKLSHPNIVMESDSSNDVVRKADLVTVTLMVTQNLWELQGTYTHTATVATGRKEEEDASFDRQTHQHMRKMGLALVRNGYTEPIPSHSPKRRRPQIYTRWANNGMMLERVKDSGKASFSVSMAETVLGPKRNPARG